MTAPHIAGWALVTAGVLVVVAAACVTVVAPGSFARLHLLTAVTSLGAPLIGLGVAALDGGGLAGGLTLVIVFVLALTGPVLGSAIARAAAQQEGRIRRDPPE